VVKLLKKEGYTVKQVEKADAGNISKAGILVAGGKEKLTEEVLQAAKKLKLIAYLGNAAKHIPVEACTAKGIIIFDDFKKPAAVIKRITGFVNNGDSFKSLNFPNIQLPEVSGVHRCIHIHRNVPGVLAQINSVFAEHKINVVSQYLMTNKQIGYVMADIQADYDKQLLKALKGIEQTISFRVLY
jgi:D-3-phosphoglycerate dehydrogenase